MKRTARSVSESLRLGGRPTFLAATGPRPRWRRHEDGVRLGRLAEPWSNDVSLLSNGQEPSETN